MAWYCIVFDIIAVYCMPPHCILWYGMVLYFIWSYCTVSHRYVPLLQRTGELPRSASSQPGCQTSSLVTPGKIRLLHLMKFEEENFCYSCVKFFCHTVWSQICLLHLMKNKRMHAILDEI